MQKFIKLLIITFTILPFYIANAQNLPDLGDYSAIALPPAQEKQLGKAFMHQLELQTPVSHDPLISNYINAIGNRLAQHAENHWTNFHFFVVNDSEINAFAGPGGYIGVNSGLILTTRNENELAATLAHEITHVDQRHIARTVTHAKELSLPTLAALIAGAVIGGLSNSDAGAAAVMAALGGSSQNMINFTRGNEEEADRIGMQTLYRAGFDPMAMPHFFRHMQQMALTYGNHVPAYLQDHPVTDVRIADAQNRAKKYPRRKVNSSIEYYLMHARLRVSNNKSKFSINYFRDQLNNHSYQNQAAAQYGYALALLKGNKAKKAVKIINNLIKHNPNQVIYILALADAKIVNKQTKEAINLLNNTLTLYPDYYPLIIQYAQTLLKANQANQARIFLEKQIFNYPDDVPLYILLARAQGKSEHYADAYQTRATLFGIYGANKMALAQLQQALSLPNLDSNTKAILQAKIKALHHSSRK